MGKRRKAREMAMQALYFMDMSRDISQARIQLFHECFNPDEKIDLFFEKLARGVVKNREFLDGVIEKFSNNWKINRMACVDRNVLRVAVYELLYCPDIPPKVSINEAIDIGKKFGTEESGAFINGILDSIRQAMEKGEMGIENNSFQTNEKKIRT